MNKIGVFYGSTTGTTEDVAHRIAEKLNVPNGDIHDASKLNDELVKEYDVLYWAPLRGEQASFRMTGTTVSKC